MPAVKTAGPPRETGGVSRYRALRKISAGTPLSRMSASVCASRSCIDGQADAANKRITDALGAQDTQPESEPGDEGDDDSAQAS